jgi:hypothetical protein
MGDSADFSFDGSKATWQQFMRALLDIKAANELGSVFARVQPPARCTGEAQRVIGDLGLGECVELIAEKPVPTRAALSAAARGYRPAGAGFGHVLARALGFGRRSSRS